MHYYYYNYYYHHQAKLLAAAVLTYNKNTKLSKKNTYTQMPSNCHIRRLFFANIKLWLHKIPKNSNQNDQKTLQNE